ncbi:hypothetical protein KFK09_003950 [Dendrobium nobile]|uniref:Staygreen protein domain-containing protein n=1 Tax=Dendrobium nobile TaxID=94219 RepID=A0A8T3C1I1_DENNO|nr:hypothetical protein KFK09_003950 [Dendrobium nobile]
MVYCFSARNANIFLSFISFSSTKSRRSSSANGLGKQFLIQSYDRRYSNGCLAARLFGPTRFDASKLKVVFVGDDTEKQALNAASRTYTLTHCDFTAKLTLVVSNRIKNKKTMTKGSLNQGAISSLATSLCKHDSIKWQ